MKIISMYLPQFHRVKENDEWWGEGFTEWTTVKKAERVYPEQYQPRVPFEDNYYDLLNRDTMQWQADLMKKYGIDGQCFYHYWFKDGRQILEKPAENLLRWKEIDMPFCFCWANETWARTWSRISGKNVWTNKFETKSDTDTTGILLEQKYGGEEQWRQHFEYLLPFFKDDRYIKQEGMPIFVIYKTALINCLEDMLEKWEAWAKEAGFPGIYVIGANTNSKTEGVLDAVLYHEPQHTMGTINYRKHDRSELLKVDYEEVWKEIINFESIKENAIYGGFVGYDDTPRRGSEGSVIENTTPEKFQHYFTELVAKNVAKGNELIFLNAWNEWGEGMYLEPDEKYAFKYLEAVQYAKNHYTDCMEKFKGKQEANISLKKEIEYLSSQSARYEGYWRVLDAWLSLKEENVCLEKSFIKRNIGSIAIYGMGMLGKHLLKELENSQVRVCYGVDRKADAMHMGIKMYSPNEELPKVDAIVVTAAYAYSDIRKQLEQRGYKNILSLEQIVMEAEK